ncbi:hypothetical protein OAH93_02765 [Flavobacteriales bacterium]|nr:hypothetical protein [Flavobacteriales bacterium]
MALFLFEGLVALAEAATTIAEGAAGAEAIAVEMGAITEATPMLAPLAAAEDTSITYGAITASGRAAQAYQNVTQAYAAAALVGSAGATAAERVWDSARKANENRKRKRHENQSARKRLHFDSLDVGHIHRVISPAKAEGLVGFPNTYTSTVHSFRPVLTT